MKVEDRRIRSLRPPVARPTRVDRPLAVEYEDERCAGGHRRSVTVFLVGAECPFTCAFCDLWRYTLEGSTPVGALPAQLDLALRELDSQARQIKLYNASNFFDPRAVPDLDREAILERIEGFERVVVESHPRLLGQRAAWWAERLGERLEVAIGLETVHPEASSRLNKGCEAKDFDRAAEQLRTLGVGLRCFLLVGAPHVSANEQIEWVRRSVLRAKALGARVASLIPVRGGNGELERLRGIGAWQPPSLELVEACAEVAVACDEGATGGLVVQVDPWDLEALAACERCARARVARLLALNARGVSPPEIVCAACAPEARR